jgi:hypothetical protein
MGLTKGDFEAARAAIIVGLPSRSRWWFEGVPLDWSFSEARRGLRTVSGDGIVGGDVEKEWADLLVFGRYIYAEGGGASPWVVIRGADGAVCGLDVEREDPVFWWNTSLDQFIRTFTLLDKYLGLGRPLPPDIGASVRDVDPVGYLESEWRLMIDDLGAD